MRTHAAVGAELVARTPGLEDVAPAVRHHHERVDGRGYPDGLVGAVIPIEARIVAVADTWSAMTEDRVYRRAHDAGTALTELERAAGSQLDPQVVAALQRILRADRATGPPGRPARADPPAARSAGTMAPCDSTGRTALVVGGAGGIGTAVCARLAAEGARVVVADRDGERAAGGGRRRRRRRRDLRRDAPRTSRPSSQRAGARRRAGHGDDLRHLRRRAAHDRGVVAARRRRHADVRLQRRARRAAGDDRARRRRRSSRSPR